MTDHEAIAAQNQPTHGETGGEATDLKTPVGESAQQPSPITDVQDRQGGTAAVGHAGKRRPSLPDHTGMYESHDDAIGRPKRARRPPAHLADFVHRITCAVAVERETSSEPPVFYSEIRNNKLGIESNDSVKNESTIDSIPRDCCAALYCASTNCEPLFDSRSDEMDPVWRCGFDGCDRMYLSERGIRCHYILHHRHKYRRGQAPIYIHDDDEYERLRLRLCRGQRHRHRQAGSDDEDDGNGASRRSAAPVSPPEAVYSSTSSVQSAKVEGGPQSSIEGPGRSRAAERPSHGSTDRSTRAHSRQESVGHAERGGSSSGPAVGSARQTSKSSHKGTAGTSKDQSKSREKSGRRTSGVLAVYATRGSDSAKLRGIDQNEQVMRCHTRGRDRRWPRMGST